MKTELIDMSKIEIFKIIEIPHLRYKVRFLDLSKLQGIPKNGSGLTIQTGDLETSVFIEKIEKTIKRPETMPYIAHEIMHVIQNIME